MANPFKYYSISPYAQYSFPRQLANNTIMVAFAAILLTVMLWSGRTMPFYIYIIYAVSVVGFFLGSVNLNKKWARSSEKQFIKHVLQYGIILRVIWAVIQDQMFVADLGDTYYESQGDVQFYVGIAKEAAEGILQRGEWNFWDNWQQWNIQLDDLGYSLMLMIEYLLTGCYSYIMVPLAIKCVLGAYTCVLIYKVAQRHFGESCARLAAIFCVLNPLMIYWCGSLMKETEMVFFTMLFVERMDGVLSRGAISFAQVLPVTLIGFYVLMYRSALAVVLFLAFFAAIVLASQRIVNTGKKVLAGVIVALVLGVGMGNRMIEYTRGAVEMVQGGSVKRNLEWRAQRDNGNQFAKYATASVFAPLIITIPFPTLGFTYDGQIPLMQMAGGNFIKNVMSFFVILVLFVLLFNGEWRQHVFPIAVMLGYLMVLVLSSFAQSGRFHMPVVPLEFLFAAYGVSMLSGSKRGMVRRWFMMFLAFEFVACIGWQFFKLKGQGLI